MDHNNWKLGGWGCARFWLKPRVVELTSRPQISAFLQCPIHLSPPVSSRNATTLEQRGGLHCLQIAQTRLTDGWDVCGFEFCLLLSHSLFASSCFLVSRLLDSCFLDSRFLDSCFLDSRLLDSCFLDSRLLDSRLPVSGSRVSESRVFGLRVS